MKRWEYSGGWKFLAVLLNQVCAVVLVLSVLVCTLYLGSGGVQLFGSDHGFENTMYYQSEVEEQIYRCIRAAGRESKFERNGVYAGDTVVDIQEYIRSNRILEEPGEGHLCYYLSDLLNWSMDGYATNTVLKVLYEDGTVGYISLNEAEHTQQSVYDENGEAVSSSSTVYGAEQTYEEFPATEDVEEAAIAKALSEVASQAVIQDAEEIEGVTEMFAPIGYSSIVEYAQKQGLDMLELQNLYYDLQNTLSMIYSDYTAYEENLEWFSPSMTNMRYVVIPKSVTAISEEDYEQKTYTNIRGFGEWQIRNQGTLLDYFRNMNDYLIFDSSDLSFESSNMPLTLSDVSNYLKGYAPSVSEDYILAIGIDPAYLANDNLQGYRQQYQELRPLSEAAVYGLFLGAALYLLSLVYLTIAAGRGTDPLDTSIRLKSFDRVKTELAVVILVLPACIVLVGAELSYPRGSGLLETALWGGCLAFLLNALFLCGYTSLIRRMRSRTLWSNSILHGIWELFANIFQNWRATTKTLITYLAFLLANLFLLLFGFWGFLSALAIDFIVGILLIQQAIQRQKVLDGIEKITEGDLTYQIPLEKLTGDSLVMAEAINNIGEGLSAAVEKSVKDERLKSDLITNVSHDIKTPLTSIINYVDLLKREDIQNERARNYIEILENKAARLQHLTEDLVEASKISSGNIKLELVRINFQELLNQTNGEFSEKFEAKGLRLVTNMPKEPVVIEADGRRLWRILENLYNNVAKYAMPNTRVYVELVVVGSVVRFSVKNISEQPLNIDAEELTERFIRGDVARSTEGSGLGLSIARNLTELQKGKFDIYLDGDLFKVTIIFPEAPKISLQEELSEEESIELLEGEEEEEETEK